MTSRLAQKWIYHTTVAAAIALIAWLQASALGLMSGDRLDAVNGHSLTSPREVLEAYGSLRDARELSLSVFRDGAQRQLHYEIR